MSRRDQLGRILWRAAVPPASSGWSSSSARALARKTSARTGRISPSSSRCLMSDEIVVVVAAEVIDA
jgi:hypothetical protein